MTAPPPLLDRDLSFRFPLLSGEDVRAVQQALIRAGVAAAPKPTASSAPSPATPSPRSSAAPASPPTAPSAAEAGTGCSRPRPPPPRPAPGWRDDAAPLPAPPCASHGPPVGQGARRWRLTPAGIVLDGSETPPRSPGPPRTASLAWDRFRAPMQAAAARFGVPVELLLATACTESGGRADAVREEPRLPERRGNAAARLARPDADPDRHRARSPGDPSLDRARLLDPAAVAARRRGADPPPGRSPAAARPPSTRRWSRSPTTPARSARTPPPPSAPGASCRPAATPATGTPTASSPS